MSAPEGLFVHLSDADLAEMATDWKACLKAIATAHQSYSIAGRTFTRANLLEVSKMVSEISYAQNLRTIQRVIYPDMSNG